MARYVLRRVGNAVLLVFISLTITFFVLQFAPGDASLRYMGPSVDPSDLEKVRQSLGLDAPAPVQYAKWMSAFIRGDFGRSLISNRPVAEILAETIPRTFLLTSWAFLVQLLIGVGVGMFAASRRGTFAERMTSLITLTVYAVPAFYLAYLAIAFFSLRLGVFPISGMASIDLRDATGWVAIVDRARHMVMPVMVLGIGSAASLARYTRSGMLDSLGADHIRTARAKGTGAVALLWKHAFRNALPPLLTVIGLSIPFLIGGAVVVEKIFAWPGMGSLLVDAIFARDYPVVLAINAVGAVAVIAGNLAADLSYGIADPRTKIASMPGEAGGS